MQQIKKKAAENKIYRIKSRAPPSISGTGESNRKLLQQLYTGEKND